jgi:hypothetical protein
MNDTESTDLVLIETRPPAVSGNTANVLALIDHGTRNNQSPEALEKLVALYERVMAKDAQAEFARAKKAFQAECPVIGANREADLGKGKAAYSYADMEKITKTIRPLLEKHGFCYGFSQKHNGDIIEVTCHLRHEAGHEESTTFAGPWATNAGMSQIQKYASATTFCQRYALRLALGLPVGADDERELAPADVPPQRTDAPAPRPRAERNAAPEVTTDQLKRLCKDWAGIVNGGEFSKPMFADWLRQKLPEPPRDWTVIEDWTKENFDLCGKELGL